MELNIGRHEGDFTYNPDMNPPPKRRLSDSPWFWTYLFGTFALVALVVIGPKYAHRQSQLERQFQARERSGLVVPRSDADEPLSTPEETIISLAPLYLITGTIVIAGWILLWWTHWRKPHEDSGDPGQARG